MSERILVFANRCQAHISVWIPPTNLIHQFKATHAIVLTAPTTDESDQLPAIRIVQSLANRVFSGLRLPEEFADAAIDSCLDVVRVSCALRFIAEHHADAALTLSKAGAHVGLSPSRLGRLFGRETGASFESHVRVVRILSAMVLMRDVRLRLKEVACAAGFRAPGEMDRQFGRALRMSPSAVRAWTLKAGLGGIPSRRDFPSATACSG